MKTPQPQEDQSQRLTPWRWLEYLSTHLGMALAFSVFAAVPLALYVRNIDFFRVAEGGTPFDSAKAFRTLLGPYLIVEAAGWVYGFTFNSNKKMVVYYTARIVIPIHLLAYCIVEASAYLFSFDVYWSGLSVFLSIILTPLATGQAYGRHRPKTKIYVFDFRSTFPRSIHTRDPPSVFQPKSRCENRRVDSCPFFPVQYHKRRKQNQSDPCIGISVHVIPIYDSHKSEKQGSHGIFTPHHATQRWRFRHYNVGNRHMCSIGSSFAVLSRRY